MAEKKYANECPVDTWMAMYFNGVGLQVKNVDGVTRFCRICLKWHDGDPTERELPDIEAEAKQNRAELVECILAILADAAQHRGQYNLKRWRTFRDYDLIRVACIRAGLPDPQESIQRIKDEPGSPWDLACKTLEAISVLQTLGELDERFRASDLLGRRHMLPHLDAVLPDTKTHVGRYLRKLTEKDHEGRVLVSSTRGVRLKTDHQEWPRLLAETGFADLPKAERDAMQPEDIAGLIASGDF